MPRVKPPKLSLKAPIINLYYLRAVYGKKLSRAQQSQIESFIYQFAEMAYKKYAKGAKEHHNNLLSVETAKKELLGEAIDLFIYSMVVNSDRSWDQCC